MDEPASGQGVEIMRKVLLGGYCFGGSLTLACLTVSVQAGYSTSRNHPYFLHWKKRARASCQPSASLASAARALPEGRPGMFLHVSVARPVAWPHNCQWRLGIHMPNSFSTLMGVENEEGGREWNLKYLAFMRSNYDAVEIIF